MELLDKVKSMTFILRWLYVLVTKKSKGKIPRDAFFVPLFLEHFPYRVDYVCYNSVELSVYEMHYSVMIICIHYSVMVICMAHFHIVHHGLITVPQPCLFPYKGTPAWGYWWNLLNSRNQPMSRRSWNSGVTQLVFHWPLSQYVFRSCRKEVS